ncbi:MAG: HPr family phosphocarrier protein [Candidatus Krumholzibacteriota bacterium]|nr:HPr family phosphocarrier protein [Candidatus Krumholzibacteriota bacterium]
MTSATVTVRNENGIHLRLAGELVKAANRFESEIMIAKDSMQVNAKSILGVAGLGAECGASLDITAEGSDEKQAIAFLTELFSNRFNVEER